MDCTEFLNRYSDYDDSLLPSTEADRFRSHMGECERCSRYDRVLRKGRMLARQLPEVEPSDDFVPRLHARLWSWPDRQRPESWSDRQRPEGDWAPPNAAAAAPSRPPLAVMTILLLLAAALGLAAHGGAELSGATLARSGATPAEQPALGRVALSADAVGPRRALLPALPAAAARGWAELRVDRAVRSSYSPLVTGPPAYRGGRLQSGASISAYRTLD